MEQNSQLVTRKPDAVLVSARGADTFDDMHDTDDEIGRYTALLQPLELCRRIAEQFDAVDAEAVSYQRLHRTLTRGAAVFGASAVVFAIVGLSRIHHQPIGSSWLPGNEILDWMELWFAGMAVAIVITGRVASFKEKWLLFRHRAESYRLLRFHFLTHPSLWHEGHDDARVWIDNKLDEISHATLEKAVREASPHGPFEGTQFRVPRPALQALTEYYLSKRLNPQKEYFANRSQRNEFSDWIRAYLPWFFFVSIVAVFCKFFVRNVSESWAAFLAVLAALLPAVAAGVRTWRSAFEFSRNKGRFEAAHLALRDLERRLVNEGFSAVETEAHGEPGKEEDLDAYPILRDLSWCEHILETEHREWLRLMYETEWFG